MKPTAVAILLLLMITSLRTQHSLRMRRCHSLTTILDIRQRLLSTSNLVLYIINLYITVPNIQVTTAYV